MMSLEDVDAEGHKEPTWGVHWAPGEVIQGTEKTRWYKSK